jgi:hypothetical protein
MHRRDFIRSMAVAGAVVAVGKGSYAAPEGWRQFEVTYRITLKDASGASTIMGARAAGRARLSTRRRSRLALAGLDPRAMGGNLAGTDRHSGVVGFDARA